MNVDDFIGILQIAGKLLYPAALVIGFAMILKAGYGFMGSEGDPGRVKEATADLVAAITGILFVVLSVTILRIIIGSVTGISI